MQLLKRYQTREDGFTLIELLIVVLIIGILAAIAIPVYLGIQQQGYKSAVRADVNISVKRVQVAITEGTPVATIKSNSGPYTQRSVKGEVVTVGPSTTTGAGADDFVLAGVLSTTATPAPSPINYTYAYDSTTGNFSESNTALAFGSSQASIAITTTTLPDGITTQAYSKVINVLSSNTISTNVFSITGLPNGLTYNTSTGTISGTPTTTGSFTVNVTVTNGAVSDSKTYTVNVTAAPVITTTTLPNPVNGTAYSQTVAATGTPASFTYALASGTLPAGLNLNTSTGVISGTPTTNGPYSFSITAQNTAGTSAAQAFSVVVGQAPTAAASTSSATTAWPAMVNVGYLPSEQPVFTGYPSPTLTATGLPAGVNFNTTTGALSGTPTSAGTYNVTFTAQNSFGTATRNATMNVVGGTNQYTFYMDQSGSASAIGGGQVKVGGWVVDSDSGHAGQYVSTGDNSKTNLRIDIQVNSSTVYSGLTDVSRSDVNSAFGGNIGNMHGFAVTLNVGTGSKTITVVARDGNGYQIIYNGTINVN